MRVHVFGGLDLGADFLVAEHTAVKGIVLESLQPRTEAHAAHAGAINRGLQ